MHPKTQLVSLPALNGLTTHLSSESKLPVATQAARPTTDAVFATRPKNGKSFLRELTPTQAHICVRKAHKGLQERERGQAQHTGTHPTSSQSHVPAVGGYL